VTKKNRGKYLRPRIAWLSCYALFSHWPIRSGLPIHARRAGRARGAGGTGRAIHTGYSGIPIATR
jgi:hypothetical protein